MKYFIISFCCRIRIFSHGTRTTCPQDQSERQIRRTEIYIVNQSILYTEKRANNKKFSHKKYRFTKTTFTAKKLLKLNNFIEEEKYSAFCKFSLISYIPEVLAKKIKLN